MGSSKVVVKVPASTANLGPGFDSIGMALDMYAWIEMGQAEQTSIRMYGDNLKGVVADQSNLVYRTAETVFALAGKQMPALAIRIYSDIPLTRGLGSSASAIVGALVAANALAGNPLSQHELFQLASKKEDHPDNVGASLFGGLVFAYWDGIQAECIRVEPNPQLEAMLVIPDFQLATEKARSALPQMVAMKDAVFNVGHVSLLVSALCTGNLNMLRKAMQDRLHEPYRAPLIPGMERILREAADYGALGAALSGAGPTLIAFIDSEQGDNQPLAAFMRNVFAEHGISASIKRLKPCNIGAQLLSVRDGHLPFIETAKGDANA